MRKRILILGAVILVMTGCGVKKDVVDQTISTVKEETNITQIPNIFI